MTTKTLTGTYSAGYGVQSPTTTLSIAAGGYVGGKGVYTPAADTGAYTVVNAGRIVGAGVSGYHGVYLGHGGAVTNGGGKDRSALIQGSGGVAIAGAAGVVTNFGTIQGISSYGVVLSQGGRVTNGSSSDTSALITGSTCGVRADAAATVTNLGTIQGYRGVVINAAGSVVNGSASDTGAQIEGGVDISARGTVNNFGTVTGGVELSYGGAISNGSNSDTGALIEASQGNGVSAYYETTLANFGTVAARVYGVYGHGGAITNGSSLDSSALISGFSGITTVGVTTVTNFGTIAGTYGGAYQRDVAVRLDGAASRLIAEAGSSFIGYVLGGGGTLELASGTGTISGLGATGTVSGDVAMTFAYFGAYQLDAGGSWTLSGTNTLGTYVTLTNDGTLGLLGSLTVDGAIDGTGGLTLGAAYGHLSLGAGGSISGWVKGGGGTLELGAASGTITNLGAEGTISGGVATTFSGFGAYQLDAGGTWTLAGTSTLGAGKNLTDYAAIYGDLSLSAAGDRLVLGAGASISGAVSGGGGTLELPSGKATITGLGATGTLSGSEAMTFSGFGVYQLDAGSSLTLSGVNQVGSGQTLIDDGSLEVNRGATLDQAGKLTFGGGATLINFGSIEGGVDLDGAGDRLIAEAGSKVTGSVEGGGGTLVLGAGTGTITNLGAGGVISGAVAMTVSGFDAYQLNLGGAWTLAGTSTLAAGQSLTDFADITGGLTLGAASDRLILGAGGSISGAVAGGGGTLELVSGSATITTHGATGTLSGSEAMTFSGFGAYRLDGDSTLTNAGALAGGVTLTSAGARLVAASGSSIGGPVTGDRGTLELGVGTGTITNLGAKAAFSGGVSMTASGLSAYQLDAGGSWTLAGTSTLAAGQSLIDFADITGGLELGAASDRLVLGVGASISGAVSGGGGTLELASGTGTITGLGATATLSGSEAMTFSGFGSYRFDAGGAWTISGSKSFGASQSLTDAGALTNLGTLTNTYGVGVTLLAGGVLTNGGNSATTALISGSTYGVYADAAATVINLGAIEGYLGGVDLKGGGTVVNGSASDTSALIEGGGGGAISLYIGGAAGTVTNYGAILAENYRVIAVGLADGGRVTNGTNSDTTALIESSNFGVVSDNGPAIVANYGSITGTIAVFLQAGGDVTNGSASDHGARISGLQGVRALGTDAVTVTNFGTIVGTEAGAAVIFGSSSDTLIVEAGSDIIGGASGGGGTLELASGSGTITGLGHAGTISGAEALNVYGFGSYVTGSGTSWTLTGTNILAKGDNLVVEGAATNLGVIVSAGAGVVLTAGASLRNASKTAIISGLVGVYGIYGAASVGNSGTIIALGTSFSYAGVDLRAGGTVTNGSSADTTALIQIAGYGLGVYMDGGAGSVANYGTVRGGEGVLLADGGAVRNGGGLDTGALIQASGFGVLILGGAGTVVNRATIAGYTGVALYDGGTVLNGSSVDTHALIQGSTSVYADRANAVEIGGAAGTVVNFGTIQGGLTGVLLAVGGDVTNGSSTDTNAYISSVYVPSGNSTVTNFGRMGGVESYSGGQTITNGSASDTGALIDSGNIAIVSFSRYSSGDVVTNFGTLISRLTFGNAAIITGNATITNGGGGDTVALIEGYVGVGLYFVNNDTLTNFGTIIGFGGKASGVSLASSTITNGSSGDSAALIQGYDGVLVTYGYTTVTNFGTIDGTGGTAVQFDSASNALIVEAGSTFVGAVLGGGGTLDLASGHGTISTAQAAGGMNETVSGSIASTLFTNFSTVEVGTGAAFTVTGDGVVGAGQSLIAAGGTLTFGQAITGAGAIVAGAGGELIVDGSAAASLAMAFTGAKATLALASPSTFAATITGFAATDVIDLLAIKATSATLGAGDILTIMNGSHAVATLQLAGTYAGDTFAVASDHHGGTDITTDAPGAWPVAVTPTPPPPTSGEQAKLTAALAAAHGFIQAMAGLGAAAPAAAGQGAGVRALHLPQLATPRST